MWPEPSGKERDFQTMQYSLIITGFPRSGTTLLQRLCHGHPDMYVTNEFGNFAFLGHSLVSSGLRSYRRLWQVKGRWLFERVDVDNPEAIARHNLRFVSRYVAALMRQGRGSASVAELATTYAELAPNAQIRGDKWPHYLFLMDRFVREETLRRLVIYRDCRDVTSSFLKMARTKWHKQPWIKRMNTAARIAGRWVKGIEIMQGYADQLHIIRYEDLVTHPRVELARLGRWLGVPSSGFEVDSIQTGNIGRYKFGLTPEELDSVMDVAGSTMERLGYLKPPRG